MKKDLLIIERNTRNALTSLLSNEGYSICHAETAGAGLEALKRHKMGFFAHPLKKVQFRASEILNSPLTRFCTTDSR